MSIITTFTNIGEKIQLAYNPLIQLVLTKQLLPVLSPTKVDQKTVFNPNTRMNQKIYTRPDPSNHVPDYYYKLNNKCIGWESDTVSTICFKNRIIKTTPPQRRPTILVQKKRNVQIAYNKSDQLNQTAITKGIKSVINIIIGENVKTNITNLKSDNEYNSFIPFKDVFKTLREIGEDILDQSDASINPNISLRLSTGNLRVALTFLENALFNLDECRYQQFVEMNRIINSVDQNNVYILNSFLSVLTYTPWSTLQPNEVAYYTDVFGQDFIDAFNSNQLITDLLTEQRPDLIILNSYMYTLSKLLFVVFGYETLTQIVPIGTLPEGPSSTLSTVPSSELTQTCTDPCTTTDGCCNFDYIDNFCLFYPTICCFIGKQGPPQGCGCREVDCSTIPPTYDGLTTINTMLWRWYDYSYCQFLVDVYARRVPNVTILKINSKTAYLSNL